MLNIKGIATGIGSLPHQDAQAALDLVFKYVKEAPFWPQLPRRDSREGMISQFSENLPCIKTSSAGIFFDPQDQDKQLEKFYERIIANDWDYFKISPDYACGLYGFLDRLKKTDFKKIKFIKCHVSGPFTFAAGLKDENGVSLLHDEIIMQAIIKGLAMKALWQVKLFAKFGRKVIVFFDEPYMGCFGSALTPITREAAVRVLSEFTSSIKSADVLTGVHCCGNTDWSIFTDIAALDIINFDAFDFLERLSLYSDNLKGFFKKGGALCWGIVPTQAEGENLKPKLLANKIKQGIATLEAKGLDKQILLDNLFLSPACGLGSLPIANSERILRALSEVSGIIQAI